MEKIINEVEKAYKVLISGGVILYPTDTIWGLGCDASNDEAIIKLNNIKKRDNSNPMLSLINSSEMLESYLYKKPNNLDKILNEFDGPTTFIYNNPKNISKLLISKDNTVAFRIVDHNFCNILIDRLNKPIVSTSANIHNKRHPNSYKEIDDCILKGVDYIVNLPNESFGKLPSSIVNINDKGEINKIR